MSYYDKHKKKLIDGRKALVPPNVMHGQSKRAEHFEDGQNEKMKGRRSVVEISKEQGLYTAITAFIFKYRKDKKDKCTYNELFVLLHDNFPSVFTKVGYSGNLSKLINSEPAWSQAYFSGTLDLMEIAELRLNQILNDDSIDVQKQLTAIDKLTKFELAKHELNGDKPTSDDNSIRVKIDIGDNNE